MQYMDESGRLLAVPPLFQGDLSIHWHFMFESPFFNPTVMIRKSILDQYNLQYIKSRERSPIRFVPAYFIYPACSAA